MIPLEQLPHSTVLSILQKMELRTWVQSRLTGPFIFDFVQENSRRFNFPCPLVTLLFRYGNIPFTFKVSLHAAYGNADFIKYLFEVKDPQVSLAGLRFNNIAFYELNQRYHAGRKEGKEQSEEDFQAFLANRSNILDNLVLPLVPLFKNRTNCFIAGVRDENIGRILEASGCGKVFAICQNLGFMEYPKWIDQPQLQDLKRIKLSCTTHFCFVAKIIRRFEYFYAKTRDLRNDRINCQEEVRDILKDLTTGPPLPGHRSATLKFDYHTTYEEGIEFESVNHRILFHKKIINSYFDDTVSLAVALIEGKHFKGLVTILYKDLERERYLIHYRMELFPIFDPERAALFLLMRTVGLRPMDISGLLEDLKSAEDIGDVISKFLDMCHSDDITNYL